MSFEVPIRFTPALVIPTVMVYRPWDEIASSEDGERSSGEGRSDDSEASPLYDLAQVVGRRDQLKQTSMGNLVSRCR